jgi:hypothetical protein
LKATIQPAVESSTKQTLAGVMKHFSRRLQEMMIVFWDVVPGSLVETHRRFRRTYYLYNQDDHTSETSADFYHIHEATSQKTVITHATISSHGAEFKEITYWLFK